MKTELINIFNSVMNGKKEWDVHIFQNYADEEDQIL
jgi:hypothetical protein